MTDLSEATLSSSRSESTPSVIYSVHYEALFEDFNLQGHTPRSWRLADLTWWEELNEWKQEYVVARYLPPGKVEDPLFVRVQHKKQSAERDFAIQFCSAEKPLTPNSRRLISFQVEHPSGVSRYHHSKFMIILT